MSPDWENSNSGTNVQLVRGYSLFFKIKFEDIVGLLPKIYLLKLSCIVHTDTAFKSKSDVGRKNCTI